MSSSYSAAFGSRVMVVAFEGWNDAGDAASAAVRILRDAGPHRIVAELDGEEYLDYQFNRPVIGTGDDGRRTLIWPGITVLEPEDPEAPWLLLGTEPSRSWRTFADELVDIMLAHDIDGVIMLGALLADVPHTRPISVFASSEDADVREAMDLERSSYEGPVGIISVLGMTAMEAGIPTISVWASVPHYVHNAPSPKATMALLDRLETLLGGPIPRGALADEAEAWEKGIDALAGDDEDMASYIQQLERARDTVDAPEASGDAIAEEFERYLRRRDDGKPEGPPRPV